MGNTSGSIAKGAFPPSRQVKTKYGIVEGRKLIHGGDREVDAFQGIPFAKPPIGELRFEKPQPPDPWEGVKETKQFGPRAMQKISKFEQAHIAPLYPTKEDCLYLNVFTPCWQPPSDKGFATVVYIHGGGFVMDSAIKYGDINICKNLCLKDVVCVTVQYRLGYFGFWTTGDETIPDNIALWDMTAALRWVQENISQFGGDPDNVTIWGQSAGGAAVDLLSICPPSRDLCHKVIAMAGNADADFAIHKNAMERCRQEAERNGIVYKGDSKKWIEEVRKIPAKKLALDLEIHPPVDGRAQCTVGPRIDGVFVTKSVEELRREASGKPRIVGLAKCEGVIFSLSPLPVTRKDCMKRIPEVIAGLIPEKQYLQNTKRARDEIIQRIIDYNNTQHDKLTWKRAWIESTSDMFLNVCTQKNVMECVTTSSEPCYFYSFNHFNPKMFGFLSPMLPFVDSTHCNDISYALGTGVIIPFTFTEEDQKVTDLFSTLITNFAKYGDPNGLDGKEPLMKGHRWEPATSDNVQKHLVIEKESATMKDTFKDGRPLKYIELEKEHPRR